MVLNGVDWATQMIIFGKHQKKRVPPDLDTMENTRKPMANSQVDKSRNFIQSGMTLITEVASDKWMKKASEMKKVQNNTSK